MKKQIILASIAAIAASCAMLNEFTALQKCEFSLRSMQDPLIAGVNIGTKQTYSDFSFMEGQALVTQVLRGSLPLCITMNVEVRNPGTETAAVNAMEWIAFIDEVQVASGRVTNPVEVPPSGGTGMIPVVVQTELFDFLEGDSPRTMINFALNLLGAGQAPTKLTMKIKPSVVSGGRAFSYPGYFTITKEFSSGG